MSKRFAVVYEADADFRTGTALADRVLIEAIGWLEEVLAHQREWVGESPTKEKLTWKSMGPLALAAKIRKHGFVDGTPKTIEAGSARRAILYLKAVFGDLAGIVLLRDQDGQTDRRLGLEQARAEHHGPPAIVIGLAVIEREAWVVAGFEPKDVDEQKRLDAERRTLGFNPCVDSHELTTPPSEARSGFCGV
ncbi:MAG: hypothetical protein ACRDD1_11505 [Planctomycetia bacterium]